ncbi:hypothetical protein [Corynebacterium timonense]|uniref:Secreted protein n=1 Tax=Corynebacterium timonense TaxID=441500 RepID=A0A1H1QHF8_9CORY|nr:hypothetical protein [Corynebacterium timonense]SDS22733.1 hypothetical protein SAMN04488539_1260 [Corynebacterium timonense]
MPHHHARRAPRLLAGATALALAAAGTPSAAAHSTTPLLDELGRPTQPVIDAVHHFADQPFVPGPVADALRAAVDFYGGGGETGGPALPGDAPTFSQFFWPTVSPNCIGPGLHSTASAIAVPGPAEIPAPGAPAGHAAFVFTALGTPPAAEHQGGMDVYWVNVSSGRTGVTPLGNNGINPTGPATLSGTADTGPGHVLAAVAGNVRTTGNTCLFAPTVASFIVR